MTLTRDSRSYRKERTPTSIQFSRSWGNSLRPSRLYRDWQFGRGTQARLPQQPDLPSVYLEDGAGNLATLSNNLALVLNRLTKDRKANGKLVEYLRRFSPEAEDIGVSIESGSVQLMLEEKDRSIPGSRLSDGMLRWLALLSVLVHPTPPPFVCIEEPELGLHPDMIPALAQLLKEASTRTQLMVTTHSVALVEEFSERPESVVVCEKDSGSTSVRRLDSHKLAGWLERYSLGQLWTSGEIGGTRW